MVLSRGPLYMDFVSGKDTGTEKQKSHVPRFHDTTDEYDGPL